MPQYRAKIIMTRINWGPISPHDEEIYLLGNKFPEKSKHNERYFRYSCHLNDNMNTPRTKAILAQFLADQAIVTPGHFLFAVKDVYKVASKPTKHKPRVPDPGTYSLEDLMTLVNQRRRESKLPALIVPDDDSLSTKLHRKPGKCPICGDDDLDMDNYDGGSELTCDVSCGACGYTWGERYHFVGAWEIHQGEQ